MRVRSGFYTGEGTKLEHAALSGYEAGVRGDERESCPYSGTPTSNALRREWFVGFVRGLSDRERETQDKRRDQ